MLISEVSCSMLARANKETILVQYSKRSPCLFRGSASLRNTRAHSASHLAAISSCAQLARSRPWPSSLAFSGPILFWRIEHRVAAPHLSVIRSSRSHGSILRVHNAVELAVSRIGASLAGRFLIDPQFSRSPDPFGCPSRSYPRSPHGGRGRFRFFHSAVLERVAFMLALRRS
jgi:hypothetical protein